MDSWTRGQIATLLVDVQQRRLRFWQHHNWCFQWLTRATDLAGDGKRPTAWAKILWPLAYQQVLMFLGYEGYNSPDGEWKKTAQPRQKVKDIVETAHQQALDIIRQNQDLLRNDFYPTARDRGIEARKPTQPARLSSPPSFSEGGFS